MMEIKPMRMIKILSVVASTLLIAGNVSAGSDRGTHNEANERADTGRTHVENSHADRTSTATRAKRSGTHNEAAERNGTRSGNEATETGSGKRR
jgi:hypothetical protein